MRIKLVEGKGAVIHCSVPPCDLAAPCLTMKLRSTIVWRLAVLGLLVVTVPASIHWYEKWRNVNTETMLDVSVSIKTISHVRVDSVGDSVWNAASGSGILISSQHCEVLTNHHVIDDAAHIEVFPRRWPNSTGISATVVNSNPRTDVALLRMSSCIGLSPANLGDSSSTAPGDEVYAVGNPLGENPDSISRGIVSHTERSNQNGVPYLQTDANVNHGNSGGALFNRDAEVIGINTAILSTASGKNFGIAYALPVNLVKREAEALRNQPPIWGDAGLDELINELSPDEAAVFKVPDGLGAVILNTTPESGPGAGKLLAKDVIYQIDGISTTDTDQVKRLISQHKPGDQLNFSIIRTGDHMIIELEVTNGWKPDETPVADYYSGYLGLTLEKWDDKNYPAQFESPVITNIKSLSPSHLAHVSSSQKTVLNRGTMLFPVQLSVKTVTGVVIQGAYFPITEISDLDRHARQAYNEGSPLLLEIETWTRTPPMNLQKPLKRQQTSFHKIKPALTSVSPHEIVDRMDAVALRN